MSGADFVRAAGIRAAAEVVVERTLVRMSPQGLGAFMAAIETPAPAYPAYERVFDQARNDKYYFDFNGGRTSSKTIELFQLLGQGCGRICPL